MKPVVKNLQRVSEGDLTLATFAAVGLTHTP
jgi:hypothetical protein